MLVGTGLIFAAVIAVWVAYGVPLALRRYDESSRAGSVSSFSGAMRILTHRADPSVDSTTAAPAPVPVTREAARTAARRRRRTLLTLVTLTVVVAVLAVLAVVPRLFVAVPLVLVAVWLVACRVQVRAELGRGRRPAADGAGDDADDELTVIISPQVEDDAPHRRHLMEAAPLQSADLVEAEIAAVPVMSNTGATLWDPIPVTLPTYVTKPRVTRTIRTIEFGEPGAWTSGHVAGQDADAAAREGAARSHQRAVGD